ncbi:PorT family protein [Maribacter algarum]|uniref:PorT family protein n=1 Tax=Maribacter algarum (ex Zhang et al. 2020) TaxID=2578118 RepID=A0A5S3PVA3_9FLAO|nr:porin family protein [Maribacter algarum]TMM58838.1 PorT family protein [Maribacter algarum]
MRKCLCILLLLLSSKVTLNAQETTFGVKAGLNYSSIIGDLTDGIKFRFSGHAGVYLEVEFTDRFSFQPELLYSSQGFQFSSDLLTIQNGDEVLDQNDIRTNVQFNYLTIPILGKFALNDRLDVEFGPQFGFLLNQVTKIKNLDQRDDTLPDDRTSTSGDFQLDYGVAAGIGINVSESFSVSPRFYIGLRNRLNGAEGNIQNYNVALQLSANYSFL